ncbi:MAG: hypothetical protein AAF638_06805 [Pseudomonadota bacterium]
MQLKRSATLKKFQKDLRGNVALAFALTLPVVAGAAGLAVDYTLVASKRYDLQLAVDSATVSTARQYTLAGTWDLDLRVFAKRSVELNADPGVARTVSMKLDEENPQLTLTARETYQPVFSAFLGADFEIEATATAFIGEPQNLCGLTLSTDEANAIDIGQNARITGEDCGVMANSDRPNGVILRRMSNIDLAWICSAGGILNRSTFAGISTECAPVKDPLAELPQPEPDGCDYTNFVVQTNETRNLYPGTYCGGLRLNGDAKVHFHPGLYVIKDGPLSAGMMSELTGRDMTLYFHGPNANISLRDQAFVDLSAPRSGVHAGVLMMQQRMCQWHNKKCKDMYKGDWVDNNEKLKELDEVIDMINETGDDLEDLCKDEDYAEDLEKMKTKPCQKFNDAEDLAKEQSDLKEKNEDLAEVAEEIEDLQDESENKDKAKSVSGLPGMYRIQSSRVERLLGTIYLPAANLFIDADGPVSEKSAYTAIISRKLTLRDGPNLFLNAEYSATDVPAPTGVGPLGHDIRLIN